MENNVCPCLLEGIISVKAAIEGQKRKIEKIYIDLGKRKQRDRKIMSFVSYLKAAGADFEFLPREDIDRMASEFKGSGNTHGGVIAFAGERKFETVAELLDGATKGDYFVYLDGVEDPYNFGYSVRTLYAMGVNGFILPKHNMMSVPGAVARASAGASELCRMAVADEDDGVTADIIHNSGAGIVCSALAQDSVSLYEFEPKNPFVLFIGGEKRGISKDFMEKADGKVHIPYVNEKVRYSLPAASVCAMYASELYRYKTNNDK